MSSGNRSEDEIFEAALQHATRERRATYLNEACGDDARLRERVEALLKAHDQAGEFLEQPPAGVSAKTFVDLVKEFTAEVNADGISQPAVEGEHCLEKRLDGL